MFTMLFAFALKIVLLKYWPELQIGIIQLEREARVRARESNHAVSR